MQLPRFDIEHLFAQHEFTCEYNMTSSDVEGIALAELLEIADSESRALWDTLTLGYAESPGHPLLRAQIAGQYDTANPEAVQVFSGGTEAAFALANVLLGPEDHVIVIGPAYQLLVDVPRATGAAVTVVDLQPEDQWELDPDRVAAAIRPNTALIIANFPHNPTGSLPDLERFEALVALAHDAGAHLLSDEIYRGLEMTEDMLPAGVDLGEHVISLSAVSKVYGLAGARVGWVTSRDKQLMADLLNYRYWTSLCTSAIGEIIALTALRAGSTLRRRAHDIVAANTVEAQKVIDSHDDLLQWAPPRGGTTAFPRVLAGSAAELSEWLVTEHGILLAPSTVFPAAGEHLRIGLGRRNFPAGARQLTAALTEWKTHHLR